MNKFLFTLLFSLVGLSITTLQAQDQVITTDGDTIDCRVLKRSDTQVIFMRDIDGKKYSTSLPMSSVSHVIFGQGIPKSVAHERISRSPKKSTSAFRPSVYIGYAQFTEEFFFDEDLEKDFSQGISFGGDLMFSIHRDVLLGMQVSHSFSTAEFYQSLEINQIDFSHDLDAIRKNTFIGPKINLNLLRNTSSRLEISLAGGKSLYRYRETLNFKNPDISTAKFNVKATEWAWAVGIELTPMPFGNMQPYIRFQYLENKIDRYDWRCEQCDPTSGTETDVELDESHFSFGLGVRF